MDTLEFKLSALTGSGEVYLPADQEYTSFNQMQKILDNTTCSLDTSAKIADVCKYKTPDFHFYFNISSIFLQLLLILKSFSGIIPLIFVFSSDRRDPI